jgi:hypothetical protein
MRADDLFRDVGAARAELARGQEDRAPPARGLDALDEPDAHVDAADALLERLRAAMVVRDAAHDASP